MKQLRFTTSEPGFMGASGSALVEERGKVTFTPTKHGTIYIDDEAERLAGYDIPKFLSGDTAQVDRPIEEQDIVMVLPSGEYPCIAEVYKSPTGDQYHLHLKKKEEDIDGLAEEWLSKNWTRDDRLLEAYKAGYAQAKIINKPRKDEISTKG